MLRLSSGRPTARPPPRSHVDAKRESVSATRLKTKLKRLYDPTGKGRGTLYSLKNLCKRESLKFDKEVRKWLDLLWGAVDDGECTHSYHR